MNVDTDNINVVIQSIKNRLNTVFSEVQMPMMYSYIPTYENALLNDHKIKDERRRYIHRELNKDIPQHEIEAFVRCIFPKIQRFYDIEEGKCEFEEQKRKQEMK